MTPPLIKKLARCLFLVLFCLLKYSRKIYGSINYDKEKENYDNYRYVALRADGSGGYRTYTAFGSASAATEAQPSAVYELTGVKEGAAEKADGEESAKYSCVANGSSIVFYNVDIQNFDMLTLTGVDSQGNTVYIAEYKAVK